MISAETTVKVCLSLWCCKHGPEAWAGTIVCAECGALWKVTGDQSTPSDRNTCTCGRPLTGKDGTGHAMCSKCYAEQLAAIVAKP